MYAGFLLFAVGLPFLPGSVYGLLGSLILIVAVAIRAVLGERTLREELPGYEAYMAAVLYQFIPYIW